MSARVFKSMVSFRQVYHPDGGGSLLFSYISRARTIFGGTIFLNIDFLGIFFRYEDFVVCHHKI